MERRTGACDGGDQALGDVQIIVVDDPSSPFGTVETWGLSELGLPELEARDVRKFLLPQAASIVRRIASHMLSLDRDMRSGETVRLGEDSVVRLVAGTSESGRAVPTFVLVDAPEMRLRCAGPCDYQLDGDASPRPRSSRTSLARARDPTDPGDMN